LLIIFYPMDKISRLNVLFLASEADPIIKVGGLGDVAGSLPRALNHLNASLTAAENPFGIDVKLVIPFHAGIRRDLYPARKAAEFYVSSAKGKINAQAFLCEFEDLPVYLISGPPIAEQAPVYSSNSELDGYKYTFFSLAATELAKNIRWKPDILHANDWHTAPAVYSLAIHRPSDAFFSKTTSLLTVHNLPYLGTGTAPALDAFGLPAAADSQLPVWAQHLALPLGLLTADAIVAVSPGYAQEILTPEFGSGLHDFLQARSDSISGILNGIDTQRWDPATDSEIAANFSSAGLSARPANKIALQNELGLEDDPHTPLLAMVTRMDQQKGVDIALEALRQILQSGTAAMHPIQTVFLGTGDPQLEQATRLLEHQYPSQMRAVIAYNANLSRRIYAGADMLLMPSRYEPCGLSQMIAMRYGCVPIARATGGLRDTIHDPLETPNSTGFLFNQADPEALFDAIQRALLVYSNAPNGWKKIQQRGMQQDFSWERSAREYLKLYMTLTKKKMSFSPKI
jgi:starch synthase